MKTLSRVMWCVTLVAFVGCTAAQVGNTANAVKDGANIAATALGAATPWGLILGGIGSVAGVIASLAGAHAVAGATAAGTDPHPISNFLANHTYFYPLITSVLTIINPWILHLAPETLSQISGMLAVAFGTQVGSSLIVKAGTADPAPTPAVTPAPAAPATPPTP